MKPLKTIFPLCRALFLMLVISMVCLAGDYSTLNIVGFSQDGRYLAFEQYGTGDGSGLPYASMTFIDVEKNSFAAPPYFLRLKDERATEAQARQKVKLATAKKLRELKIVPGNLGKLVVSRLLTDLNLTAEKPQDIPQQLRFAEEVYSMSRKGDYTLTLQTSETKTAECEIYNVSTAYKIELSLRDNFENKTTVLQKDATLPKSRGCALDYQMQNVYVYKNRVIVFLNVFTPGFEGSDMNYLVVAGKLS